MKNIAKFLTFVGAVSCGELPKEENKKAEKKTYSIALAERNQLPLCTDDNISQLAYIKNEKTFVTCESDGWNRIETESTKDPAEDFKPNKILVSNEAAGENCSAGGVKVISDAEDTHYICNGSDGADGSDGIDGVDGLAGVNGVDGADGIDGQNGIDGADGINGVDGVDGQKGDKGDKGDQGEQGIASVSSPMLYTDIDDAIGYMLDFSRNTIMLNDGSIASVSLKTGLIQNPYVYSSSTTMLASCYYKSSDCSGTCYLGNEFSDDVSGAMANWLVKGEGNTVYKLTGNETLETGAEEFYSMVNGYTGICSGPQAAMTLTTRLEVTNLWDNPNGLTYPFGEINFN